MRIPSRRRELGLRFDITALIDIVFNLVIFFLVATHFVSSEAREVVNLPVATETDERPTAPRRLIVTVRPDGSLIVSGRESSIAEIEAMIAGEARKGIEEFEVQIRGDRTADFAAVEPILLACARAGVTRVGVNKLDR